jgi:anaerobic ribonucleoside-triphosphate reductase
VKLRCRLLGHLPFHDFGTHDQVCDRCGKVVAERDTYAGNCTRCGRDVVAEMIRDGRLVLDE